MNVSFVSGACAPRESVLIQNQNFICGSKLRQFARSSSRKCTNTITHFCCGSSSSSRRNSASVSMLFTGIVEEIGVIRNIKNLASDDGGVEISVECKVVLEETVLGDSISVNGTCLTVTEMDSSRTVFKAGLAPETLRCTNLGDLVIGSEVNLERSLAANGRLGGHFVQGHVDGVGIIVEKRADKDAIWFVVELQRKELTKYIVKKGYIAVDGTSLTVCEVSNSTFEFMLVPYTQDHVIIPKKEVGDKLNIEVDITGKYIERFLEWKQIE
mmetsp:Transcript_12138/g.21944  ORF Transcript_12138/g.21944 Transcript_12138/m.21944 type:complete len:270 (-) Transcript_12138:62-871(-)